MSQRTDRVDELLREEIGTLLAKEVADPRIGFATITDVETSPDLRHAKVWVSVIGQQGDRDETLRALGQAMPFIRHELGRRLRIRRIPELHVRLDDSAERGTRVLHLLSELESGVDPEAIAPINESLPTPVPRLPQEGDVIDPDAEAAAKAAKARKASGRRPRTSAPAGRGVDSKPRHKPGYRPGQQHGQKPGRKSGGSSGGSSGHKPG